MALRYSYLAEANIDGQKVTVTSENLRDLARRLKMSVVTVLSIINGKEECRSRKNYTILRTEKPRGDKLLN